MKSEVSVESSSQSRLEEHLKTLIDISTANQQQQQYMMHAQAQQQSTQPAHNPAPLAPKAEVSKLPKLSIPKFNGDVLKWFEFRDMFVSAVDSRCLSSVDKFSYLISLLSGAALASITGLQITDVNYAIAWKTLQTRFGNKQTYVDAYYAALRDLPTATEDPSSLRAKLDRITMHLRSLDALGESASQAIFVSIITCKLPRHALTQLELKKGDTPWSVASLCDSLRDYVVAHEAAVRQTSSHAHADPTTTNSLSTAAASSAHSLAATSTSARTCAFCGTSHPSYECRKYPDAASRKQHSKDRCYICLRNGHNARTCKSTSSCYYCKSKRHHSSLCPTKFPAPQASVNAAEATSASSSSSSSLRADAPGFTSEQHQLSAF